ncbi:MAG: metal-sulfur cluster assembly factor [Candidatus Binatia bacterium]
MITEEQVYEVLSTINDPEIPVNIVELGLIYSVEISADEVRVTMTLTTPGCGMAGYITGEAEQKIRALDGVGEVEVGLVWDPPWNPQMISEEGRKRLGFS